MGTPEALGTTITSYLILRFAIWVHRKTLREPVDSRAILRCGLVTLVLVSILNAMGVSSSLTPAAVNFDFAFAVSYGPVMFAMVVELIRAPWRAVTPEERAAAYPSC